MFLRGTPVIKALYIAIFEEPTDYFQLDAITHVYVIIFKTTQAPVCDLLYLLTPMSCFKWNHVRMNYGV